LRVTDERVIAFRITKDSWAKLVAHPAAAFTPAGLVPVFPEHAIRGIYSVTLWLDANELTGQLLTNTLASDSFVSREASFATRAETANPAQS